jgi:hypothetical protein
MRSAMRLPRLQWVLDNPGNMCWYYAHIKFSDGFGVIIRSCVP